MKRPMVRHARRGQALTEFALLLPILVLILSTILDFGMAMYTALNLNKVAQDAAMAAAYRASDDTTVQSLVSAMANDYGLSGVSAQVTRPIVGGTSALQLTLSYTYQPISPAVKSALNGGVNIGALAVYAIGQ